MSCLALLTVKPATAQTKPSVPEFTVQLVKTSQLQTVFWAHPFNTWNISVHPDNESAYTIELIVKNQPFNPYKENITGTEVCLEYNVRIQIGNSSNWITVYSPANRGPSPTNSDYIIIPFPILQSSQHFNDSRPPENGFYIKAYYVDGLGYSRATDWIPAGQVQVGFQVEALIGYENMIRDNAYSNHWVWVFEGQTSDWSDTQTITIPAGSTSPLPSPTVPELSWLAIVPLLAATLFVAIRFRIRKNTAAKLRISAPK